MKTLNTQSELLNAARDAATANPDGAFIVAVAALAALAYLARNLI